MYVLELITTSNPGLRVAVGTSKELFSAIVAFDCSPRVVAWRIEGHIPSSFGWADSGWERYSEKFTTEHYKQST